MAVGSLTSSLKLSRRSVPGLALCCAEQSTQKAQSKRHSVDATEPAISVHAVTNIYRQNQHSNPSLQQIAETIRITGNCKAEDNLLPGQCGVRAKFLVPAQVEQSEFRQQLGLPALLRKLGTGCAPIG